MDTTFVDRVAGEPATPMARDLKVNLKRLLEDGALEPTESLAALLAAATAVEHGPLARAARAALAAAGVTPEQVREAAETAAIMGMLNTYYRFRHMLGEHSDYQQAGLRMTSLAKPALGKERFEMLAFAVSVLNGCESCIRAHERALREGGVAPAKIHDLARLAAVTRGLKALEVSGLGEEVTA